MRLVLRCLTDVIRAAGSPTRSCSLNGAPDGSLPWSQLIAPPFVGPSCRTSAPAHPIALQAQAAPLLHALASGHAAAVQAAPLEWMKARDALALLRSIRMRTPLPELSEHAAAPAAGSNLVSGARLC